MKNKKQSISKEMTIISMVTILIIFIIYSSAQIISFSLLNQDYEEDRIEEIYEEVIALSEYKNETLQGYLNIITDDRDQHIRIYKKDSIIYKDGFEYWNDFDYYYDVSEKDISFEFSRLKLYNELKAPINIDGESYTIQIVKEMDIIEDIIEGYFPVIISIMIIAIILSLIGSIYISRKFLKRLKILINNMEEVRDTGIKHRVYISENNDEFDKVNLVFNDMMDKVEESFNEQERFISDASHELKTPLTAIQGHLNMLKRWGKNDKERLEKSLDICLSEIDRLKHIVNDMLILSRAEKTEVNFESIDTIDVKEEVQEIIQSYILLNDKVIYNLEVEDNIKVSINKEDFKQLLIIFIDNAIKYNDKEVIEIAIKAEIKDKVILSILDNGIGIPKEEIKNVKKRLYKVDKSRKKNDSFGIGLSIADRIIKKYNEDLFINSEVGKFTEIKITLNTSNKSPRI